MTLYPNAGKKSELAYRMLLYFTPFRSSLVGPCSREGERTFDGEVGSLRDERGWPRLVYRARVVEPV